LEISGAPVPSRDRIGVCASTEADVRLLQVAVDIHHGELLVGLRFRVSLGVHHNHLPFVCGLRSLLVLLVKLKFWGVVAAVSLGVVELSEPGSMNGLIYVNPPNEKSANYEFRAF
jgi:hypothetical protein